MPPESPLRLLRATAFPAAALLLAAIASFWCPNVGFAIVGCCAASVALNLVAVGLLRASPPPADPKVRGPRRLNHLQWLQFPVVLATVRIVRECNHGGGSFARYFTLYAPILGFVLGTLACHGLSSNATARGVVAPYLLGAAGGLLLGLAIVFLGASAL